VDGAARIVPESWWKMATVEFVELQQDLAAQIAATPLEVVFAEAERCEASRDPGDPPIRISIKEILIEIAIVLEASAKGPDARFVWSAYNPNFYTAAAAKILGRISGVGKCKEIAEAATRMDVLAALAGVRRHIDCLGPGSDFLAFLADLTPHHDASYLRIFENAREEFAGRLIALSDRVAAMGPAKAKRRKYKRADHGVNDGQIRDAWDSEEHPNKAELADALGYHVDDVKASLERTRKARK
jgi:hypothetical protein